ncbi:MAG: hypothetical protein IH945_01650 [Armatimonadetes bacterium]|nr:hypothetical protein [Armatimonadota bacterium]
MSAPFEGRALVSEPRGSASLTVRRTMAPVDTALNVWASVRHHQAAGGTDWPVYREILTDPAPVPESRQIADRSDQTYDATRGKYERRRPRTDVRVTSAIECVERALGSCKAPDWLRRFLLFKYPTVGRYVPRLRVAKSADPEYDPARAFVDSGHWSDVLGTLDSPQLRRNAAKTMKSAEREFKSVLRTELRNEPEGEVA